MKNTFLVGVLLGVSCMAANQFIIEKKQKKGPSRTHLQESCCQFLGNILQALPPLLRSVADLQQIGLIHVSDFVAGKSGALLGVANKEKLQQIHEKAADIEKYLEEVNTILAQKIDALNNLVKK